MKRQLRLTGVILGLALGMTAHAEPGASDGAAQATASGAKSYIVQMAGDPLAAYEGGIEGMPATKPDKGKNLDARSAASRAYTAHLNAGHDQALRSVGGRKIYDYNVVFNGFAAVLTPGQVEALKARGDVLNVWEDELLKPHTNSTPDFIGLTEPGEPWSDGFVGEDVVIGMIDTGIQPDHPSLADEPTPKKGNKGPDIPFGPPPAGFTGTGCEFGNTDFNPLDAPFTCNNKLLKAEAFSDAFLNANTLADGEFLSARDSDGHGTHTTTTAGGNFGVEAEIDGEPVGIVSGMAPRARIATYKVCWDAPDPDDSGCFSSDSMAAIDQAVGDGVDVINFSIGGPSTSFTGPDDIAFLFAQDAGVFVAVSAGNEGPGAQTIGSPSGEPWVTATAAAEDNENFGTGLQVTSPVSIADTYEGLEGAGPVTLADAGTISADVVPGVPLDGCAPLSNGADIDGNIALIIRGTCGFIVKYTNAQNAGAQAIVVYNDGTAPDRIDPIVMGGLDDTVTIPGLMIGFFDGDLITTTAATETVTGTVSPAIQVPRADRITGFSSRGPNGGAPDIIKPDIAAPGVRIIAGETLFPNANSGGGQFFQFLSGTSMSSPHTAGVFALLKQAHPDWTAAMARSALMTTARQDLRKTFGEEAADPFDIGAGFIVPDDAFEPGLAYDAGLLDYLAFLCGAENQADVVGQGTCDALESSGFSLDSSDLNLPSIGIAELAGTQSITRTVTNVGATSGSFQVSVEEPSGIDVSVSPSIISVDAGESASYEVTFTATGQVALDEWVFGSLTWTDGQSEVRSPIAIRPVALLAPDEVTGTGTSGSLSFEVGFGYNGPYEVSMDGLVAGVAASGTVEDAPASSPEEFVVPEGTTLARFAIFDEDVGAGDGSDDLDLRVFRCLNRSCRRLEQVGASGSPTSAEEVNLVNPVASRYLAVIDDFASAPGPTAYTIFNFNLDGSDAGNTTITAPPNAVVATTGTVNVDWADLEPGTRHLGILSHSDGTDTIGETEVAIDAR
ncbi:MAG: S8 family serine peptidase [Gammaproteobacteria bacterium]